MSVTLAPSRPPSRHIVLPWVGFGALALGGLAMLAMFAAEAQAAVSVWISSTAFGHCFLVLPIAAFLAWERRAALAACIDGGPALWAGALLLPLAVVWLAVERLGIMEGRQLVALTMFQVLAFTLLGRPVWRVMAVPLLYLYFLVPFGAFLTPALQDFTTAFIDHGLTLLAIPHVVQATFIQIPAGTFRVAEACAGLRFLIASVAFGVLYACTLYRSAGRRIAFVVASIVVPILANGCRALGIVVLGDLLGSVQAATVDHLVYGWVFFTIVTFGLILGGLPFRQDRDRQDRVSRPTAVLHAGPPRAPIVLTAIIGLVVIAAGPAAALMLDRASDRHPNGTPVIVPLVLPAGCTGIAGAPGAQRIRCGDAAITMHAAIFPADAPPLVLLRAARALAGPGEPISTVRAGQGDHAWDLVQTAEPARLLATGFWTAPAGAPSGGLSWRVRQAEASVFGGSAAAWHSVLATAEPDDPAPPDAAERLRVLLASQPDVARQLQPPAGAVRGH